MSARPARPPGPWPRAASRPLGHRPVPLSRVVGWRPAGLLASSRLTGALRARLARLSRFAGVSAAASERLLLHLPGLALALRYRPRGRQRLMEARSQRPATRRATDAHQADQEDTRLPPLLTDEPLDEVGILDLGPTIPFDETPTSGQRPALAPASASTSPNPHPTPAGTDTTAGLAAARLVARVLSWQSPTWTRLVDEARLAEAAAEMDAEAITAPGLDRPLVAPIARAQRPAHDQWRPGGAGDTDQMTPAGRTLPLSLVLARLEALVGEPLAPAPLAVAARTPPQSPRQLVWTSAIGGLAHAGLALSPWHGVVAVPDAAGAHDNDTAPRQRRPWPLLSSVQTLRATRSRPLTPGAAAQPDQWPGSGEPLVGDGRHWLDETTASPAAITLASETVATPLPRPLTTIFQPLFSPATAGALDPGPAIDRSDDQATSRPWLAPRRAPLIAPPIGRRPRWADAAAPDRAARVWLATATQPPSLAAPARLALPPGRSARWSLDDPTGAEQAPSPLLGWALPLITRWLATDSTVTPVRPSLVRSWPPLVLSPMAPLAPTSQPLSADDEGHAFPLSGPSSATTGPTAVSEIGGSVAANAFIASVTGDPAALTEIAARTGTDPTAGLAEPLSGAGPLRPLRRRGLPLATPLAGAIGSVTPTGRPFDVRPVTAAGLAARPLVSPVPMAERPAFVPLTPWWQPRTGLAQRWADDATAPEGPPALARSVAHRLGSDSVSTHPATQDTPPVERTAEPAEPPLTSLQRLADSQGAPLPLPLLTPFEHLFRTRLNTVTIHTDIPAAQAAQAHGAAAMTLGQRIFFAPGHFQPETPTGRALLAHELTHVVQQRTGPQRLALKSLGTIAPAEPSAAEREAETIEHQVLGLASAGAFPAQALPLVARTPAPATDPASGGGPDAPALGTDAFPAIARFAIERAPDGATPGGGGGQGPLGGSAATALIGGDTPGGGLPTSDVDLIADRVYSLLKDRLAIERERHGRWL